MTSESQIDWCSIAAEQTLIGGMIFGETARFMEWAEITKVEIRGEHTVIHTSGWYDCLIKGGAWSLEPKDNGPVNILMNEIQASLILPSQFEHGAEVIGFHIPGMGKYLLFPINSVERPKSGTREYLPD